MDERDRVNVMEDEDWGEPIITGELPAFWKPEETGEKRFGEIVAVRKTKVFEDHQGEALNVRGPMGMFAIPISAGLATVDWRREVGKVFRFTFMGWREFELEDGTKNRMRVFVVQPIKGFERVV